MEYKKMKCSSCGASLDPKAGDLQTFCPYCGQKLYLDGEGIDAILIEKEKTKRFQNRQEAKLKEQEMKAAEEEKNRKITLTIFGIWFAVLMVIAIIGMSGDKISHFFTSISNKNAQKIELTFSADEINKDTFIEISERFSSLGFNNIEIVGNNKVITGWIHPEGSVEKVSIDGDTSFEAGDWFPKNAEIVITIYTKK